MKKLLNSLLALIFASVGYSQDANMIALQKAETIISNNVESVSTNYNPADIYTIPVVFHVLHTGDVVDVTPSFIETPLSANVSREQITTAVQNLSERFRNTWLPYWDDEAEAISIDAGIQFELAHRDPNGNPTSGILRHDMSSDPSYAEYGMVLEDNQDLTPNENQIKAATGWPRENYLNIWVASEVNDNDGGCGGTAFGIFPVENKTDRDGVVIQHNRLGYGNFHNVNGGLNGKLVEAVATYLGLYQTWHNTPTCAAADAESDCSNQGDFVCDTPPTVRNCSNICTNRCEVFYGTPLNQEPDTYNYMDDTGDFCKRRFTQGQVDRMRSTLSTLRSDLTNYVWTAQAVHDLAINSISINRTGYNKYTPIIELENNGDFTEATWSVTVTCDQDASITYTIDHQDLTSTLGAGSVFNIEFPEVQLTDFQTWSFTAEVTNLDDEYVGNNTATHQFNKTQDGFLSISAGYNGSRVYTDMDIVDVDNDKLILDGRKYWAGGFKAHRTKNREDFKFLFYGETPDNEPFPFLTGHLVTDQNIQTEFENIYYLAPGNYRFEMEQGITNSPIIIRSSSCTNGCYITVKEGESTPMFTFTEADLDNNGEFALGFNEGIHNFTIPNDFVSTEASCLADPLVSNGFCDDAYSTTLTSVSTSYERRTDAIIAKITLGERGYNLENVAALEIFSDPARTILVTDTVFEIRTVSPTNHPSRAVTNVVIDGLAEATTYYARTTFGQTIEDTEFITRTNSCTSPTLEYYGRTYDLVSIGDRCWFANELTTTRYANGDSIPTVNDLPSGISDPNVGTVNSIWQTKIAADEGVSTYYYRPESVVAKERNKSYYSYDAVQDARGLCPTGWRVASWQDWHDLDEVTGENSRSKLLAEDAITQVFAWGYTDNEYQFNAEAFSGKCDRFGTVAGWGGYWASDAYAYNRPHGQTWIPTFYLRREHEIAARAPVSGSFEIGPLEDGSIAGASTYGYPVRCVTGGNIVPEVLGNMDPFVTGGSNGSKPSSCNFEPWATQQEGEALEIDECGVCGGLGIPKDECDCQGNVPDAIGICGGDCDSDENNDGICDNIQALEISDCLSPTLDGHTYSVAIFGTGDDAKCWFTENLRTTTDVNGVAIPEVTDGQSWGSTTSPARCSYDNDVNNVTDYGYLYNWYAIENSNICPTGWHVPTDSEWKLLETSSAQMPRSELNSTSYRGISQVSGEFIGPNGTTDFSGEFGGIRVDNDGGFREFGSVGYYWTADQYNTIRSRYANSAWHRAIFSNNSGIGRYRDTWQTSGSQGHGMSVRCIKD